MKVKVTFIAETSKWDSFDNLKSDAPQVKSRSKWEKAFAEEVNKTLQTYLVEDEETEKVYDVKAKIIERKDNE
jgi:hypothetical protein